MTEDTLHPKQRTNQQLRALWLFFELLAKALNEAGLEPRKVLKPEYNLQWTKEMIHDNIFIPIQKAMYGTDTTAFLRKHGQIEKIHEIIMREMGEKHGLEYIPFPHDEKRTMEKNFYSGEKLEDYPENDLGEPTF